jgi:hypothetical protein
MTFLAVLGVVAILTAVSITRPDQVATGILVPALFITPIALVVSAAVGGIVGGFFGAVDLSLFALAGLREPGAEPTP